MKLIVESTYYSELKQQMQENTLKNGDLYAEIQLIDEEIPQEISVTGVDWNYNSFGKYKPIKLSKK